MTFILYMKPKKPVGSGRYNAKQKEHSEWWCRFHTKHGGFGKFNVQFQAIWVKKVTQSHLYKWHGQMLETEYFD